MKTKVLYKKIVHPAEQSFSYSANTQLTMPLHSHDDYELIYIAQGHGWEFISDSVKTYSPGDLVLIGSNVPHLHLCNSVANHTTREQTLCELLQFPSSLFPRQMDTIQEYAPICNLLHRSQQGIRFTSSEVVKKTLRMMRSINRQQGIGRITSLLNILDLLGKTQETMTVSATESDLHTNNPAPQEVVFRVCNYINNHFKQNISLHELAKLANMTPASLCRYFKRKTNMTLFQYLNDRRIKHACKLLAGSSLNISQIAYESGFNNLSHFNKHFKLITQQTPTLYRERLGCEIV